jgi:hypothetical protein
MHSLQEEIKKLIYYNILALLQLVQHQEMIYVEPLEVLA